MPTIPEREIRRVLDAEREWKEGMERVGQELKATEFHDVPTATLFDFERMEAKERAQNQAPLDIAAMLREMRDAQETERQARVSAEAKAAEAARRQERKDRRNLQIAVISCAASVIAAIVGVLAFLGVHP